MSFCGKCGHHLEEDDEFCPSCGASVRVAVQVEADAPLHDDLKCPECGETIPDFEQSCPSCGHVFSGREHLSSIADLSDRLDEIEATRPTFKKRSGRAGRKAEKDERLVVSPTDERKVTLIQSYPIPNNKTELAEFLILAASNVNPKTFAETSQAPESERAISNAWYSKLCQAYEKAQLILADDAVFPSLEKKYRAVEKAVEKNEKKTSGKFFAVTFLCLAGLYGFLFLMKGIDDARLASMTPEERVEYNIEQEEKSCESEERSVRYDIKSGEYDDARNAVYAIDFDSSISEERHEYWENRKAELLQTIDAAENGGKSKVGE